MSLSGSSLSRWRSWAMTRLAMLSSMGVPRKMMRSLSSLEKMSKERSPRLVCSITMGTRLALAMGSSGRARAGNGCGYPANNPDWARAEEYRLRAAGAATTARARPCTAGRRAAVCGRLVAVDRWEGSGSIRLGSFARDLHPMVVHFPVALLLTGLALELVAAVRGSAVLARTALLLLVLGLVAAMVAVATGLTNPEVRAVHRALAATPPSDPGVRDLFLARLARIRVHERLGLGVLAAAAVAVLVRLRG